MNDPERRALEEIGRIDAMGGALRAIETGYIQGQIELSAYEIQRQIESGERVVVGVNRFRMEEEEAIPAFRLDPSIEREQIERLRELRASRNADAVAQALDRLEQAARGGDNLMPFILEAAERSATVGEISDRLRRAFGEHR